MENLIPLVEIVETKRGQNKEFFINFFERCNLRCGFCWQDHEDWTGIDTIVEKADLVINNTNDHDFYSVNVMGGELFMDELPDSVFEDYLEFCRRVVTSVKHCEVNFVTNLVFEKTERVVRFVKTLEEALIPFTLCTSYDVSGRFNTKTFEVFERNLAVFKPWLSNISVVLTRPNIERFMRGPDPALERLYQDYPIFFDYYSPEDNAEVLQPSDVELVDFFLWLNEHYPDSQPIKAFRENQHNPATCRSSFIILPTGVTGSCRVLADRDQFKSDPTVVDNIHESEARFIQERECLSCEFYQKCGLGCFLHSDHVNITNKHCEFKRLYEAIA